MPPKTFKGFVAPATVRRGQDMPNRIIRAGIISSDKIDQLDFAAEVFYRRLLNAVDDHGLFDARPNMLRATLYPLRLDRVREADITRWLAACEKAGLILLYEADSKPYLKVLNTQWESRSKPKYPLPSPNAGKEAGGDNLLPSDDDCAQSQTDASNDAQLSPYSNTYSETNSHSETDSKDSPPSADVSAVFSYWQTRLNHPTAKLTAERKRKVQARLREGYSVEQIKQAIDGCASSPFHLGQNDNGQVYDDLELICRNGSKIEQFIQYAAAPPVKHLSKSAQIQKNNLALVEKYRSEAEAEQEAVNA